MARYDAGEINRAFTRICCMSCTDWRSDAVRAKVAMYLIGVWDGQNPKPPSPRARRAQRQRRYCQRVRLRPALSGRRDSEHLPHFLWPQRLALSTRP